VYLAGIELLGDRALEEELAVVVEDVLESAVESKSQGTTCDCRRSVSDVTASGVSAGCNAWLSGKSNREKS
jgi:hypothetical protein